MIIIPIPNSITQAIMKKIQLFRHSVIPLLFFIACDNVTLSPILGKWQLKSVEKNGDVTSPVDTVWYNFQSKSIFSLQIYEPQQDLYREYVGLRTQEEKTISISLLDEGAINFSDWNSTNRSFTIVDLNRKRLLLQSEEGFLYSFIKF